MSITYCECVFVDFGKQRVMRMKRTAICSLNPPFFHIISYTARFSGRRGVLNTKCVFWFSLQLSSETFLILRRTEQDMIKKVNWSSCKVPVILVRSYWNLNFLNRFSKNTEIPNLTKIRPVGAELLHADGRTDRQTDWRDKANSRFPQFYKRA
jgi:hypothetical protein